MAANFNSAFANLQYHGKELKDIPATTEGPLESYVELAISFIAAKALPEDIDDFDENLPYHVYNLRYPSSQNALFWLEYARLMREHYWTSEPKPCRRDVQEEHILAGKRLYLACLHHMEAKTIARTMADYVLSLVIKNLNRDEMLQWNALISESIKLVEKVEDKLEGLPK